MDNENEKALSQGVSLYTSEWELLQRIADQHSIGRSAVMRKIIAEWQEQRKIIDTIRAYQSQVITKNEMIDLLLTK
jgi:hypothetical protein